MAGLRGFAPAKINLTLHVTGQRADGYHLLDSLVFADVGDSVQLRPAAAWSLRVDGSEGGHVPAGDDNLVLRVARLFPDLSAALTLTKDLPVASGIGGGSADAAAVWRGLTRMRHSCCRWGPIFRSVFPRVRRGCKASERL